MKRRSLLAALAVGASGFAGCAELRGAVEGTATSTPTPAPGERTLAELGFPGSICEADPVDLGIYAVDEPVVAADWSGVDAGEYGPLADDEVVVGVERGDRARAYPLPVLRRHEVVNDRLGGPILVTYCPLCNSAMVAERRVDGAETTFGVSGQLWQPPEIRTRVAEQDDRTFGVDVERGEEVEVTNTGNLVLYDDATGSYWSQLLATAICGPRRGEELTIVPASVTTWGDWRGERAGAEVLLPPPHSGVMDPPA